LDADLSRLGREGTAMSNDLAPEDMPEAILDERWRIRRLRATVDLAAAALREESDPIEANRMIRATRRTVLNLFPGSQDTFDLILAPRFRRILMERGLDVP
jgi:hypothetical protein